MLVHLAHNLPAPRTSLIGRERDISETRYLVLQGRERLVTLTGVGGSGKTRLALQVAADLYDAFPDGVWLVELAGISDPLLLPETVASVLGLAETSSDSLLNALVTSLGSRTLLIVLDNCEHVIDACAMLVDTLLSACSNLRVLATSREPLQITGERQYRVPPLRVPVSQLASYEELAGCPAVQLFVERAFAVEASFQLTPENAAAVARICTLLDGIPLALELAAARIRVLSVEQISQRLDDCFRLLAGNSRSAPTRQQTLKATLDWSYNLLSFGEQAAFRRLAVLVGRWDLDTAEAVCAEDGAEGNDLLDNLTRLVDKSLVVVEEQGVERRYRLLEPVRQYGMQLIEATGELQTIRERLASFYVVLAERAEPELHGPAQLEWMRRIEGELDGIRAVMRWSEESNDVETSLRLAGALHWYFWMRRHLREGQRWLEAALARDGGVPPKVQAKALMAAAMVCSFLGEYPKGLRYGQAALAIYQQLGDVGGLTGYTALTLAHINLGLGDLRAARSLAEESIAFARQAGLDWMLGQALVVLGEVVHQQGDTSLAVSLHEQAIMLFREQEDSWSIRYAMVNLASLQQNQPDIIRATAISSVQLYWEQRDQLSLVAALEYLAGRVETRHPEVQVKLFAATQSLRKTLGALSSPSERDDIERHLNAARASLGEARFAAAWAEGCTMSLEQVVQSVLNEEGLSPMPKSPTPPSRSPGPSDNLTRRELEVAKLVALGYTDRQIADELTITEGTAGNHVHHILEKLGFRSRVQVTDWAIAQGLIEKSSD